MAILERIYQIIGYITSFIFCLIFGDSPPRFRPWRWNSNTEILDCNNCYNYASNIRTDTYAQPGYASGYPCNQPLPYNDYIQCLIDGALSDGLKECSENDECTPCGHKVVLFGFSFMRNDYHWCRQDRDGTWSDKNGTSRAMQLVIDNIPITDPRDYYKPPFYEFVKFFCVKKDDVEIGGSGRRGGLCQG